MNTLQEDVDFLEHFGVKGMKWGVRRQRRLERTQRVAEGKGSLGDNVRVLGRQSALSLARGKGLKGAAARSVQRQQHQKERIQAGQATVKDYLSKFGTDILVVTGSTK